MDTRQHLSHPWSRRVSAHRCRSTPSRLCCPPSAAAGADRARDTRFHKPFDVGECVLQSGANSGSVRAFGMQRYRDRDALGVGYMQVAVVLVRALPGFQRMERACECVRPGVAFAASSLDFCDDVDFLFTAGFGRGHRFEVVGQVGQVAR